MAKPLRVIEPDCPMGERPYSEDMLIDGETAREWRDKKHFERQRPLSPENIRRLIGYMKHGTFTPGTQVYICVLPNGAELIVNANHTLEAIAACAIPQWLTVTRKHVADINEAGVIYATFDQHKRRTLGDSFRGYGIQLDFRATAKVGAALNAIMGGFAQVSSWKAGFSHTDIAARLENYRGALTTFGELIDGTPADCRAIVTRGPIMAVALETIRYQPSLGEEFWGTVARDTGLVERSPEHSFIRYFRNNPKNVHRPSWAKAAALAWNAKFEGRELTSLRPDSFKNFVLIGTPHDKGIVAVS